MSGNRPFVIVKAVHNFRIGRKDLGGFPFVVGPSGVEPRVHRYLQHRVFESNLKIGSVEDEAWILKSWCNHVHRGGWSLVEANNNIISQYALECLKAGRSQRRVQRCVNVVFSFYVFLSKKCAEFVDIVEDPLTGRVGVAHPISAEIAWKVGKHGEREPRLRPQFRFPTLPEGLGRPTPDSHEIERVLEALLESTDLEPLQHARWIMAQLMATGTLRCAGVASLTTSAISEALTVEGISGRGTQRFDLRTLASDGEAKDHVRNALTALNRRGREAIFPLVTEKRDKVRRFSLDIDLAQLIVEFIWTHRVELVSRLGDPDDALFPSFKTGRALKPNSVGNILKSAFNDAGVDGSGHRLRAACAESITRKSFLRSLAIHGSAWDRASVLMDAAEQLGHKNMESLRYYLNRVIGEVFKVGGEPLLVGDKGLAAQLRGLIRQIEENPQMIFDLEEFLCSKGVAPIELLSAIALREKAVKLQRALVRDHDA